MHPHEPRTGKERKALGQLFAQLMGRELMHVRVDYGDQRQWVKVVGSVSQMHGPQGVCTCCPRARKLTVDGDPVG